MAANHEQLGPDVHMGEHYQASASPIGVELQQGVAYEIPTTVSPNPEDMCDVTDIVPGGNFKDLFSEAWIIGAQQSVDEWSEIRRQKLNVKDSLVNKRIALETLEHAGFVAQRSADWTFAHRKYFDDFYNSIHERPLDEIRTELEEMKQR